MSKEMSIIALGAWVIVLPYLGIYRSWLTLLLVVTGIALMVIGFLLRGKTLAKEHHEGQTPHPKRKSRMSFAENTSTETRDYSTDNHTSVGSLS